MLRHMLEVFWSFGRICSGRLKVRWFCRSGNGPGRL